jgi:flagellar biosynthetic protein FliR
MLNSLTALLSSASALTGIFLVSLRLGATLLFTPVLSFGGVPLRVRVLLVLGLAGAMWLGLAQSSAVPSISVPGPALQDLWSHPGLLVQAAATEMALGATLGLGIHLAFAAFAIAGRLLDIQIGFGLGQVFDPATNANMPVLATAFNQIAVLTFFLVDGHHALFRGIAFSLERFPVGQPWPIDAALGPIARQVGGLLGLAFSLAAPVAFCLLVLDFALGVVTRSLPQFNMFAIGIPIKVIVGLVALSFWFAGIGSVMNRVYASIYETWSAMLPAAAPSTNPPARPR